MNIGRECVALSDLRLDGGAQIRDGLAEAWVEELADLYRDGHDLPPGEAVRDPDGNLWLWDGYHRLEAKRRAIGDGAGFEVHIREGDVHLARFLAAMANKHGLPRTQGDKRRAILLARQTPDGAKMSVRELARHCGVSKSYVSLVMNEDKVSSTGHPKKKRSRSKTDTSKQQTLPLEERPSESSPVRPFMSLIAELGGSEDDFRMLIPPPGHARVIGNGDPHRKPPADDDGDFALFSVYPAEGGGWYHAWQAGHSQVFSMKPVKDDAVVIAWLLEVPLRFRRHGDPLDLPTAPVKWHPWVSCHEHAYLCHTFALSDEAGHAVIKHTKSGMALRDALALVDRQRAK